MSKNKSLIAVTMGDPSGISTEITIKAWIKKNKNLRTTTTTKKTTPKNKIDTANKKRGGAAPKQTCTSVTP